MATLVATALGGCSFEIGNHVAEKRECTLQGESIQNKHAVREAFAASCTAVVYVVNVRRSSLGAVILLHGVCVCVIWPSAKAGPRLPD